MAFFDKLSDMAKTIGDKAGEAIESTKLNSKINSEQTAINALYQRIGAHYYEKHQAGEDVTEEAAAWCVEINEHNAAIAEAKAEIERIKAENAAASVPAPTVPAAPVTAPEADGVACPDCGKQNSVGTKFCQECGGKLETARICVCGATVAPGVKFCGECGAKFE